MTETLFSLEIHVESVKNIRLPCKLPALCFRLLDFPTMIIHHVPPLRAEKLRQKLLLEDRETMLDELKDRFGHFQFHKGKSCLFKASIETLQAQLQTVPLYAMLMDWWPKKPTLVGSTVIPLKEAVNKISADVYQKGLEVPSFFKSEGEFTVYNLMGSGIATVKLGFRLLSLGGSLIPHIPREALSIKTTKKHEIGGKNERSVENVTDFHAIRRPGWESNELEEGLEARTVGDKSDGRMVQDRQSEGSKCDTGVQTNILAVNVNSSGTSDQDRWKSEDDFVITNTFCPPPLYYNCNAAPQSQSAPVVPRKYIPQSGSSSATQISHKRDKMSDVDFLYYDPNLAQADGSIKLVSASVQTDDKFMTVVEADQTRLDVTRGLRNLENFTSDGRLPVLSALLQELSCLSEIHQSSQNTEHKSSNGQPQRTALHQTTGTKKYDSQAKTKSLFAEKGSKPKTQGSKKFPSSSAQTSVIGLSGRKVRFKQTNLTYGMTKTQKMRLALNQKDKTEKRTRPCDDQAEIVDANENIKGESSKHKPLRKAELERTYRIGPSKRFALREVKRTADVEIQTQSSLEELPHENRAAQRYGLNIEEVSAKEDSGDPSLVERNTKSPNSLEVFIPRLEGRILFC